MVNLRLYQTATLVVGNRAILIFLVHTGIEIDFTFSGTSESQNLLNEKKILDAVVVWDELAAGHVFEIAHLVRLIMNRGGCHSCERAFCTNRATGNIFCRFILILGFH